MNILLDLNDIFGDAPVMPVHAPSDPAAEPAIEPVPEAAVETTIEFAVPPDQPAWINDPWPSRINEPISWGGHGVRLCGADHPPMPPAQVDPRTLADPIVLCPTCQARRVLPELRRMTKGLCWTCSIAATPTPPLPTNPPAPKGREWLRGFLVPEQLPPEEQLPTIQHHRRPKT